MTPPSTAIPTRAAHPSRLPDMVLLGITMLWGASFLTVQTALQWSGPFGFVSMRFTAAACVALLLARHTLRQLNRGEVKAGVIMGLVLLGGYGLQTSGLNEIPSSKSAFLTALYVPLVPLCQWLLFRRPPSRASWLGVGVAFTGLVLLSNPAGLHLSLGPGEYKTLVSALMSALEICSLGFFAHRCDPRRVAVVQLWTVAISAFVVMQLRGEPVPTPHPVLLGCVAWLGLTTSMIQIAMNWAQKTIPPTRATLIYAMEPVWGGVVGAIAGEQLGLYSVLGAGLIVASVLVSELGDRWLKPSTQAYPLRHPE